MLSSIDHGSMVKLVQIVGFCVFFVLVARLRPWRWLLPFFRGGRHG